MAPMTATEVSDRRRLAPRGEDTCGEQEDAAEDAADAADGERHEVERVPLPPG